MREDAARFSLVPAATLDEALAALSLAPGAVRPLSGGTDLMVLFGAGHLQSTSFVDLSRVADLKGIVVTDEAITVGALTTYTELLASPVIARELPMLAEAARVTGGWAIQNRGTLGGNIANASPAADSSPALLAYDAAVELRSTAGQRWVPYGSFHTGYKTTVLLPDELITRIRMPRLSPGERSLDLYRKVGPRRAQAISKVCLAARVVRDGAGAVALARFALGGVAPTVVRCGEVERALERGDGPLAHPHLAAAIAPIDDVRSTARYRRHVAGALLGELIRRMAVDPPMAPEG